MVRVASLFMAVAGLLVVSGCLVTATQGAYVRTYDDDYYTTRVYYATPPFGPPPPRVEVIGVAPYPGYIWIQGSWVWEGRSYGWREGHWQAPPRYTPPRPYNYPQGPKHKPRRW